MTSTKAITIEEPEPTDSERWFHALHQMPELRMRVGETRNKKGGRVWADTGEPSVPLKDGCKMCARAYEEHAK